MNITMKGKNKNIAHISSNEVLISNIQSALDLAMTIKYTKQTCILMIDKSCVIEDFFILSTRLAGELLQKYINYGIKLAIIGDFSVYTSKPLHDFIYESNNGSNFFFVKTEKEAIDKFENTSN